MEIEEKQEKRTNVLLFWGMFFLIISTQGILNYFLMQKFGLGLQKKAILPLGIFLVFSSILFIRNMRFSKIEILFLIYMAGIIIANITKFTSFDNFYISFREVWLFYIFIVIFSKSVLSDENKDFLLKLLLGLGVLNIIAVIGNYVFGMKQYMMFFTGRFYYPWDTELGFKMSNFSYLIRSPGLVGESAQLGYFGLCAYVILKNSKYSKWAFVGTILVFMSTTRSVILGFLIYFIFEKIINLSRRTVTLMSTLIIAGSVAVLVYLEKMQFLFSVKSVGERMDYWKNINLDINLVNILSGGYFGDIGRGAQLDFESFLKVFDNYWLFSFFNYGVIGIILTLLLMYQNIKKKELRIVIVSLICSGVFVNLFQAIPNVAILPMIILLCKGDKIENIDCKQSL